jgi:hypothetical protein
VLSPTGASIRPIVLIDRYLHEYDVVERHHELVLAPAEKTYEALRSVDLSRSRLVRGLLAARGLPRLVRGRRSKPGSLTIDDLLRAGFVWLDEEPGRELVLGVIGTFWKPGGGVRRVEPAEFAAFDEPGLAKAVWNFRVLPDGSGRSFVTSETRVRVSDEATRRKFLLYWAAIGPFSGLIRKRALRLVKRDAERPG